MSETLSNSKSEILTSRSTTAANVLNTTLSSSIVNVTDTTSNFSSNNNSTVNRSSPTALTGVLNTNSENSSDDLKAKKNQQIVRLVPKSLLEQRRNQLVDNSVSSNLYSSNTIDVTMSAHNLSSSQQVIENSINGAKSSNNLHQINKLHHTYNPIIAKKYIPSALRSKPTHLPPKPHIATISQAVKHSEAETKQVNDELEQVINAIKELELSVNRSNSKLDTLSTQPQLNVEEPKKLSTPINLSNSPYQIETIQSLFSYDPQTFVESTLQKTNSTIIDQNNNNNASSNNNSLVNSQSKSNFVEQVQQQPVTELYNTELQTNKKTPVNGAPIQIEIATVSPLKEAIIQNQEVPVERRYNTISSKTSVTPKAQTPIDLTSTGQGSPIKIERNSPIKENSPAANILLENKESPTADRLKNSKRIKKIVVRLNDLQRNTKPQAPKIVSKSDVKLTNLSSNVSSTLVENETRDAANEASQNQILSFSLHSKEISQSYDNFNFVNSNENYENNSLSNQEEPKLVNSQTLNNLSTSSNGANLTKSTLPRPAGKNPYGVQTIAQCIDKLKPYQIKFLQTSSHLNNLRELYPKVRINLNECIKSIYLFGPAKQVLDTKRRLQKIIDSLRISDFKLDSVELATFLKKASIKEKLTKFIQFVFDTTSSSANLNRDDSKFCFYDVITDDNSGENKLSVCSNSDDIAQALYKYIIESIRVNYKLNVLSRSLIEMIKRNESESKWSSFYKNSYENRVDYYLKQNPDDSSSEIDSNSNSSSSQHSSLRSYSTITSGLIIQDIDELYGLYVTGFKEDVDEFCSEFKNKFSQK